MMNRREAILSLGAAALSPALSSAAADLAGDVAILRQALALHPGLYRYNSPRAIEARLAALEPAFVQAPGTEQRFLLLSRFLASIRCGHSFCNPLNQRRATAAALFDRPTRLPLRFRWIDGAMVVTHDDSGTGQVPRGSVVERLGGIPSRDLLARLMPYARADGANDAKRRALLEVRGTEQYETFDIFQGLLAPPSGNHRLELRLPDGQRRRIELPPMTLAARRALLPPEPAGNDQPVWTWQPGADGIVTLTMPTWVLYDSKWNWRRWIDDRLDSLKGAKGLIVDLRDNEGGQDCGDLILARLSPRDLSFEGLESRIRFRRTPESLNPYLDTWDDSFRTLGEHAVDLGTGWYRREGEDAFSVIPAKGPHIAVPMAVLVGPVNSSATFQFAQRVKQTGLGRLFGEPSGGNRRGINGGCFFFVRLPASGLEFDLPLVGTFPRTPQPDAGIAPDVTARETAATIAAGNDPARAAATAWLRAR
jgi:hypothetical protein